MVLLLACVENKLAGTSQTTGIDDEADDTATAESDTVPPTDTADSGAACEESEPPDGAIPVTVTCPDAPFSGEFVEAWRASLDVASNMVHAARLVDGDGDGAITTADPMHIVVDDASNSVATFDHDGTLLGQSPTGAYRAYSTTADADPALGSEVVTAWYIRSDAWFLDVGDTRVALAEETGGYPWVTDLEGDGELEVLLGESVVSLTDGETLRVLEGLVVGEDMTPTVSADLDRDGVEEILAADWDDGEASVYGADGARIATCVTGGGPQYNASWAIGNLDGDEDGEFVAAGHRYVALCDTDGTLLARANVGTVQPGIVGLGQLDLDEAPEFTLTDYGGVIALDDDLSVLWTWYHTFWTPHSLADLDRDGVHEVLVNDYQNLVVLDATGAEIGRYPYTSYPGYSWLGQPIVVDVDADGLAEIVVGSDVLVVLESPEGGWLVEGADQDWPSYNHHPGDRGLGGGVRADTAWWNEANVWQGLPVATPSTPELAVGIVDVCVESCEGDALVTVEIGNPSRVDIAGDVALRVLSVASGDTLASDTVPGVAAGATRSRVLRVPASELASGVLAEVEADVAECDEAPNTDAWYDTPCPRPP